MSELEPVEGWDYLKRDLSGDLVLESEDSGDDVSVLESADIPFTSFYEQRESVNEISERRNLSKEKVREVVYFAESSSENLHELARKAYEKRKMVEEASGEKVEEMMDRALGENGYIDHIEYGGPFGKLQDLVEKQADKRDFKLRYDPSEEDQYRSGLEVHVIPSRDSDDALYFGMDESGICLGSTATEVDKQVTDIEGELIEGIVEQELNSVAQSGSNF